MTIISNIKQTIAFLLLITFALSTFPKSYIHSALADHHDYENACSHKSHKTSCVKLAGINCHYNNLVVNLPFIYQQAQQLSHAQLQFQQHIISKYSQSIHSCVLNKEGRAPPNA